MVNKQSLASVFLLREHDPIWLRVVVEPTGRAARKYVAKERDRMRGGKRREGMKSKINNSWLPLPTTTSSSTRGASERGTRARSSCRQGSERLPSPKLIQKPNLTYLLALTLLSAFQHLHLVFFVRAWRKQTEKKVILSNVFTRHS